MLDHRDWHSYNEALVRRGELNLFCFMYNQMRDRVKFDGLLNLMEVSP